MKIRALIARVRAAVRTLRQSAARFEHRGVVVAYSGVVVDQTAVVRAIDAAVAGMPKHARDAAESALRGCRVLLVADSSDGLDMTARWRHGLSGDVGEVRAVANEHAAENIRAGLAALARSRIGLPPESARSEAVA